MKNILLLLVIAASISCVQTVEMAPSTDEAVNAVLDDWHVAAADADFDRYFNHFASDSSIFMGTDATERWTVAEFRPWAKPYFDRGKAWDFTAVERHLYFSDDGSIAWFDEVLDTPNLGPARGTGVLVSKEGEWKIAHYNLSIPIPNAIADTVIKQVERALEDRSSTK
ncbi:nuclear transport factor 2 family protein [Fodinibius saliphilus]|uniref:nuclear transport factor 2 family protein n=1 Tax=Fodinibius saliphilus TaxID=1920650 RepID=UPI00110954B7|nr:nuclear transport factor 2 family protein [Fodinibius saliphilus]